jgi:CDP-diacylglycerol--glycerol-3-phosphate 3-phosphatidyltransferase
MKPEFNLPNMITASRIVLTPVFIFLMVSSDGILVQCAAAVFLIAAISDWYDGWYARRYNETSAFGRFFDPLADKVLTGAAFFAFVFLDVLPLWMVIITVGRDFLVTLLRVAADRRHMPMVTSRLAKIKTALQLAFLWYIVAIHTLNSIMWLRTSLSPKFLAGLSDPWIVLGSMLVLTALSVITFVQYLLENRHLLRILINGNYARTTS